MKAKTITIVAFLCSMIGVTQTLHAETTGVDSICNLINGVWYQVYLVQGYTGHKFTVYNSDSTVIRRIPGTDSITWKDYDKGIVKQTYNYAVSYGKSSIRNAYSWKLGSIKLISLSEGILRVNQDVYDGNQYGYAKANIATGITQPAQRGSMMFLQPTNDIVSIQGLPSIDRLEIRDLYGRIQRQVTRINVDESIDVSALSAGIYLIKVYSGKESYSGKIIIK